MRKSKTKNTLLEQQTMLKTYHSLLYLANIQNNQASNLANWLAGKQTAAVMAIGIPESVTLPYVKQLKLAKLQLSENTIFRGL